MRLNLKQLKNLSVETVSGVKLGHVSDIIFEIDGQLVAQYESSPSILSTKNYLISRDQVVRFESDKLIVDDSAAVVDEKGKEKKVNVKAEPVMMRDQT